jgi:major membrane immunogen (membrane-anchored lipoprotein)
MNKTLLACCAILLASFSADNRLNDGIFKGESRSYYTNEPYYGHAKITVKDGMILQVDFSIRDSVKHEDFDDRYERYFEGNDLYVQQCRNDRKGVQSYPDSLMKYQDLEKVDVISGATWSYNIFKASAQIALEQAHKK